MWSMGVRAFFLGAGLAAGCSVAEVETIASPRRGPLDAERARDDNPRDTGLRDADLAPKDAGIDATTPPEDVPVSTVLALCGRGLPAPWRELRLCLDEFYDDSDTLDGETLTFDQPPVVVCNGSLTDTIVRTRRRCVSFMPVQSLPELESCELRVAGTVLTQHGARALLLDARFFSATTDHQPLAPWVPNANPTAWVTRAMSDPRVVGSLHYHDDELGGAYLPVDAPDLTWAVPITPTARIDNGVPAAAADLGGMHALWVSRTASTSLWAARWPVGEAGFDSGAPVLTVPPGVELGTPRLASDARGTWLAAWRQTCPGAGCAPGEVGLFAMLSRDGGRHFEPPVLITAHGASTVRDFEVWLGGGGPLVVIHTVSASSERRFLLVRLGDPASTWREVGPCPAVGCAFFPLVSGGLWVRAATRSVWFGADGATSEIDAPGLSLLGALADDTLIFGGTMSSVWIGSPDGTIRQPRFIIDPAGTRAAADISRIAWRAWLSRDRRLDMDRPEHAFGNVAPYEGPPCRADP